MRTRLLTPRHVVRRQAWQAFADGCADRRIPDSHHRLEVPIVSDQRPLEARPTEGRDVLPTDRRSAGSASGWSSTHRAIGRTIGVRRGISSSVSRATWKPSCVTDDGSGWGPASVTRLLITPTRIDRRRCPAQRCSSSTEPCPRTARSAASRARPTSSSARRAPGGWPCRRSASHRNRSPPLTAGEPGMNRTAPFHRRGIAGRKR